jgi:transcription elongation GreA/GreB family factor
MRAHRNESVPPRLGDALMGAASFGAILALRRDDGRQQTFRIVKEDQADPRKGPSLMFRLAPELS